MVSNIQIKSVTGVVLFEYKTKNNSIKITVEKAVEMGISLCHADLMGADLSGAKLIGADFYDAFMPNVDLSYANLHNAHMDNINLNEANLHGTDFSCADLNNASFCHSNLQNASFSEAKLHNAFFHKANLRYACFSGADLSDADLSKTNLYKANFNEAYLNNTDLDESNFNKAKIIPFIPTYLPDGEFIGWKKFPHGIIAKLKILEDSKRSRANSDKCRCDKALVLEFQNIDGSKSSITEYMNDTYTKCLYKVGEIVYADSWDDNRWNECTHGIHFFIDRESAVKYSL